MIRFAYILLLISICCAQDDNKIEKLPTGKIFLEVKDLWVKKEERKLQKFFAKKIYLNLGKQKGLFSREQATGVFKTYFESIEIIEFKYYSKKTKSNRGMVYYRYKCNTSGKRKQKIIYICLQKQKLNNKSVWLIFRINIIG